MTITCPTCGHAPRRRRRRQAPIEGQLALALGVTARRRRPTAPRVWPWAPLGRQLALRGADGPLAHRQVCFALGASGTKVTLMMERGLTDHEADRAACRIGLHPALIWQGWS